VWRQARQTRYCRDSIIAPIRILEGDARLREERMGGIQAPLSYLLIACGVATTVLIVLVIYGNSLSVREEDQIYLNKGDEGMLAADQRTLVGKMDRLEKMIFTLALIAGILVVASTAAWIWIGLR
jgi:hypothetical protein